MLAYALPRLAEVGPAWPSPVGTIRSMVSTALIPVLMLLFEFTNIIAGWWMEGEEGEGGNRLLGKVGKVSAGNGIECCIDDRFCKKWNPKWFQIVWGFIPGWTWVCQTRYATLSPRIKTLQRILIQGKSHFPTLFGHTSIIEILLEHRFLNLTFVD